MKVISSAARPLVPVRQEAIKIIPQNNDRINDGNTHDGRNRKAMSSEKREVEYTHNIIYCSHVIHDHS